MLGLVVNEDTHTCIHPDLYGSSQIENVMSTNKHELESVFHDY